MRHRLYVHLTWTTRDREPLLTAGLACFLSRYLPAAASKEKATLLALGMVATHVHLLLRLDPAADMARLVQRLKGGSAFLATREGHAEPSRPLRWARGYSVESVSPRAVPDVVRYLERQPQRHPTQAIPGWPSEQLQSIRNPPESGSP